MNCGYRIVFVFFSAAFFLPQKADAQFWKRWSKKRKHSVTDSVAVKKAPPVVKKKTEFNYPPTQFKQSYRIDVLAPIYLNELVNDNKPVTNDKIPEKATAGIEFYKGLKLAADTLNKLNFNIDLYVHDIADSLKSIDQLISSKELGSSDLIIGVLQSKDLPGIANFARNNHINFVSALSPSDAGINNNPYFTLLQPSLHSHCEHIKQVLVKRYPKKVIHLFYHTSVSVDETAFNYLSDNDKGINSDKVNFDTEPEHDKLKLLFDSTQVNVIVMSFFDIAYSEKLLNQLSEDFPAYKFEVYGMPSWKSINALHKKGSYPNIVINVSEPFYYEHNSKYIRYVEKAYRKEFGGRPGELVYRGYETLLWYADLLRKYGTIFNPKMSDNSGAPFTKFQLKAKWDKNKDLLYNENKHVYMFKYTNGSYTVE